MKKLMGMIKSAIIDNFHHKFNFYLTKNVIVSGVCLVSLLFITLLILVNNRLSPHFVISVSSSSIVSWSISLPNTALTSLNDLNKTQFRNVNETHYLVERNETHVENIEFEVKNVSFFGKEMGFIDKNSSGSFEIGVKIDKMNGNGGFMVKDCDIFDGKWVRDENLPYYPPGSCPFVDPSFNCHLNGRPDFGFYKWKWQPNGCNIPRMNATDFLERLRGKKLVFVGDSLNRNMWESLVCLLRHSIEDKRRVYEISGKREFRKQGFYSFRFEDYNCSVDYVRAPFLVRESTFGGKNGPFPTLRLDLMDKTTRMYKDAHVIVFNTGHWWTHEKTSKGEEYYQEGNYVYPRLEPIQAYKKALTTWSRWVDMHVDRNKTLVFFRGYSGIHFRGGQWNSGGQCHKETEPIFNETYLTKYPPKMRTLENILEEMKTRVVYLNISRLTDYRKDAHPSIYRKSYKSPKEVTEAERSQDCSHWCLPGVPDVWNELLYASLMRLGWGSLTRS